MIEEKEMDLFLTDNYKVLSLMNQPCYLVGGAYTSITQKERMVLLKRSISIL